MNRTVILLPTVGLSGYATQNPKNVAKIAVDDSTYIQAPLEGTGEWDLFRFAIPSSPVLLATTITSIVPHVRWRSKNINTPAVYGATVYRFYSPSGSFADDDMFAHSFGDIGDPMDDGSDYRELPASTDGGTWTWADLDTLLVYGAYLQPETDAEAFRITRMNLCVHCTDSVTPPVMSGSFPWPGRFNLTHKI